MCSVLRDKGRSVGAQGRAGAVFKRGSWAHHESLLARGRIASISRFKRGVTITVWGLQPKNARVVCGG